jgi:guanosine-diphosphatase
LRAETGFSDTSSTSHLDTAHIDTPTVEDKLDVVGDDEDEVEDEEEEEESSTTTAKTPKPSAGSKHDGTSHSSSHKDSSKTSSSSKSDPALTTKKCKKPYDADKPLIQYVLMVDAGSTGSRIHVYRFNNCGPTPELEDEIFEQTAKIEGKSSGLSAYANDPEAAAKSLDVLLDVAVENVPESVQKCTPVAVKATAGLRKVGEKKSNAILKAVRERLETEYPFPVVSEEDGGVEVMDGEDEAVYAWITVNYLQGKIGTEEEKATAAVFDLGGGSTQIVFEPTFMKAPEGGMPQELSKGDHRHELSFGGRDFILYQHSYLGFGLNSARENVHRAVINNALGGKKPKASDLKKTYTHPCFLPGTSKEVEIEFEEDADPVTVNMTGPSLDALNDGILNAATCRAFVEMTMEKDAACDLKPCAFGGVHQPSFSQTFAANEVYLLSYFYDRVSPLGLSENFTIAELKSLSHDVCAGIGSDEWERFEDLDEEAFDDLKERPESCLDLSFMVTLLHIGYGMPIDREVKIAKKLQDNELGWCLGAR